MSIWEYRPSTLDTDDLGQTIDRRTCPFCEEDLRRLPEDSSSHDSLVGVNEDTWVQRESSSVSVCPVCGWWRAVRLEESFPITGKLMKGFCATYAAVACLLDLDLADLNSPLKEVRQYLLARYQSRNIMHPRLFEETVADVFRDFGYHAMVTSYSGDGGIDVILNDGDSEIGVQVKRYRDSIEVEQIRSLVGALVLRGITRGVFVTTSSFQQGAEQAVSQLGQRGYAVELVDGDRFLSALRIARRAMYQSTEELRHLGHLGGMKLVDCRKVY